MAAGLLAGYFLGLLSSIPPGPASFLVLRESLAGRRRTAAYKLLGILGAETLILLCLFSFLPFFSSLLMHPLSVSMSGFVLMAMSFLILSKRKDSGLMNSTFLLSILNPAIWISLFSFIVSMNANLHFTKLSGVAFVFALQLGVLSWFGFVIFKAHSIPARWQSWLIRAVAFFIFSFGFFNFVRGFI